MVSMRRRPGRPYWVCLTTVAAIYLLYSLFTSLTPSKWSIPENLPQAQMLQNVKESPLVLGIEKAKVPLEAHIMSKCPDAKDCLKDLIVPTMQKVWDKVNFTLSYIGTPTSNDGVECKHGATECLGNILELCAARLYPSPINYLGFTMCMTETYKDIPQRYLVEGCALEHGISFDALNDCASEEDGAVGMGMLRNSVAWSSSVGVEKSCTVRLNNEIYCIRDDGEWKDCKNGPGVNDLAIAVEKLYRAN